MSERARNALIVALLLVMAATLLVLVATAPSQSDRVQAIGERIKCPVCQGESIANSPATMARDMMDLVGERVEAGTSDDEIVQELLSSYSGAVLLDPPASGWTLFLWLAPVGALLIGAAVIWTWRRTGPDTTDDLDETLPTGGRRLIPIVILGVALAVIVGAASFFLQERDGPAS